MSRFRDMSVPLGGPADLARHILQEHRILDEYPKSRTDHLGRADRDRLYIRVAQGRGQYPQSTQPGQVRLQVDQQLQPQGRCVVVG
jgi:hypothetical protein